MENQIPETDFLTICIVQVSNLRSPSCLNPHLHRRYLPRVQFLFRKPQPIPLTPKDLTKVAARIENCSSAQRAMNAAYYAKDIASVALEEGSFSVNLDNIQRSTISNMITYSLIQK